MGRLKPLTRVVLATTLLSAVASAQPEPYLASGIDAGLDVGAGAGAPLPARLDVLVHLLSVEDPLLRWDLAGIALNEMVYTYQESLDQAADEHPHKAAARRKLWSWQRGTGDLLTRVTTLRNRLENGAPFELIADDLGQVLILIEGEAVIVAGYDRDSDRRLREDILRRFCDFNDCWWLGMQPPE